LLGNKPVFKTKNHTLVLMFLIPVILVDLHRKFKHFLASKHHIFTLEEYVPASRLYCYEEVVGGDLLTKLINLMADPERCKRQSPVPELEIHPL